MPGRYSSLRPKSTVSWDVAVLMAVSCGQEFDLRSQSAEMLHLKTKAIEEIKVALADDTLCTADQTIAAVAQIAAYEVLFGDSQISRTYMQGLKRMIYLRGGLVNLGLEGFLEEFILWIDSNLSHILGESIFLEETEFPTSAPQIAHPKPNLDEFGYGRHCLAHQQLGAHQPERR